LYDALEMSEEEKSLKHHQLYDYISTNTSTFWVDSFVKELLFTIETPNMSNTTPLLDFGLVVENFKQSKSRVFFLDYDGTLTPIRKTPSAAVPPPEMLRALELLSRQPDTLVYVISGRDQATLEEWLGHITRLGLRFAFVFIGLTRVRSMDASLRILKVSTGLILAKTWTCRGSKSSCRSLRFGFGSETVDLPNQYYTERTPGSFVEHKASALTWHYRLADPDWGYIAYKNDAHA
jgi:trehalose 6-phosphate synthase/phosphatase